MPLVCPIKPTPAAEPTASRLPPTPVVSVTSNHCPWDISGVHGQHSQHDGAVIDKGRGHTDQDIGHAWIHHTVQIMRSHTQITNKA